MKSRCILSFCWNKHKGLSAVLVGIAIDVNYTVKMVLWQEEKEFDINLNFA